MGRSDDQRVPRGTSGRWEVILADEERTRRAPRLRALDVRAHHRIVQAMSDDDLARIAKADVIREIWERLIDAAHDVVRWRRRTA